MAENADNLMLDHLRHIRGRVDQITEGVGTIELRMQSSIPSPTWLRSTSAWTGSTRVWIGSSDSRTA